MARGGFRPGAGRPRLTEEEKAARRAEREAAKAAGAAPGKKAAKKKGARKPTKAKAAPRVPVVPAAADIPEDVKADAAAADLSPLDYMLQVMRSNAADPIRRDRMAIAAAPFVHGRKEPVGQGKREAAKDAATEAASVFKTGRAPLRAVG